MDRRSLLVGALATGLAGGAACLTTYGAASRDWPGWAQPADAAPGVVFTGAVGATGRDPETPASLAPHATAWGIVPGVSRDLLAGTSGSSPVDSVVPGTRVLRDAPGADALVHATSLFLEPALARHAFGAGGAEAGTRSTDDPVATPSDRAATPSQDPRAVEWSGLATSALLDVHSLTWAMPSPVAGWVINWRYTWPRDTAHVIVTLAEHGHVAWAAGLLANLANLASPHGQFDARYVPGTSRPPDSRPPQFDGTGWVLWAAAKVTAIAAADADGPALESLRSVRGALARCVDALLAATGGASIVRSGPTFSSRACLPSPSPDYWEKPEHDLTLATAASAIMGLQAGAALAEAGLLSSEDMALPAGAGTGAQALEEHSRRVAELIRARFGPRHYQRYASGGGADVGLLTLLPPYVDHGRLGNIFEADFGSGAERADEMLDSAFAAMRRPAGGVAPAEFWKRDGISWTPQTAMFAQAYAHCGRHEDAARVLTWLASHRTSLGALPEKVRADGGPAGPAPLAWPSAVVASTLLVLGL